MTVSLAESLPWHFGGYIPPDELRELEGTALAWIESHCEDGKKLLLAQFRGKPRLEAVLCALLAGVSDLDDAAYQMLTERWLDTAEGVQLDQLGQVLDLPRAGWVDETYRALLRAQVLALRSDGTWPDLFAILRAIGVTLSLTAVDEPGTASIRVVLGELLEDPTAEDVFRLLDRARAGGVRLTLEYPTAALASSFTLSDVAGEPHIDAALGLGDTANAATGGQLAGVYASEVT